MEIKKITSQISEGTIHYIDHFEYVSGIEWAQHPKFKGVYLKNMINGSNTEGLFSSHIVKIDPDCTLETHCHDNQMELHEVIEGDGVCTIVQDQFEYHLGKMAVIPKGEMHSVQAGKNGLTLLAKFFPALI